MLSRRLLHPTASGCLAASAQCTSMRILVVLSLQASGEHSLTASISFLAGTDSKSQHWKLIERGRCLERRKEDRQTKQTDDRQTETRCQSRRPIDPYTTWERQSLEDQSGVCIGKVDHPWDRDWAGLGASPMPHSQSGRLTRTYSSSSVPHYPLPPKPKFFVAF